jgi:hypothetical protein
MAGEKSSGQSDFVSNIFHGNKWIDKASEARTEEYKQGERLPADSVC